MSERRGSLVSPIVVAVGGGRLKARVCQVTVFPINYKLIFLANPVIRESETRESISPPKQHLTFVWFENQWKRYFEEISVE